MSIVAEAVAGAALSAFFDVLFENLSSSDLLNIFWQENVDADLKKWKTTLLKIREVLDDAEDKQMTKESVKTWLGELEDLAYDADDILDEFATEALRRKLNAEEPSTSKIRKFIPACCVGFNPSSIVFDVNMQSKIKGINTRLQKIVTDKEDLELIKNTEGRTRTTSPRRHTTSLVNEGHTYGRDEDKKAIVKLLLESSDAQLSVIPIIGMGGLGKTTLAQLVFKDDDVSRHFDLKVWVCVSEDFDNVKLTKEILRFVTSESCDNNLESLQGKLQEKLSGKKFLLILDDVWNENYEYWTELCKPFEFGALGSKIVVTTRNDGVSSIMRTTPPYKLKELSRDACLRVFTHHALGKPDFSEYPELEEFGQKIVDRCKGAPLAAKVLGGLLRTKHDPYEWKNVLNSKIWDIPEEKGSIFSCLKLSYNYLPSHLKRCFAYCSLFPKDYNFKEKKLVLLWMAEGLVQETKEKPMEDLGREYFRGLLNRSFFQQSSSDESRLVMHDLIHDLAQWAAGNLCYRLEDQLGGSEQFEISTKVRHFSYITYSNDCIIKVADFLKDMHLRTFLLGPLYFRSPLANLDANCLLPQLRYLRVLSLDRYKRSELPSSIGDLKHLRYLNLSYSVITSLPESTSSLCNLQTLLLKGCFYLTKLPEKIENLVNLRHLNIKDANSIIEMPVGIAKLKSLQTLSNFVVGKDKMVDLMNLESLRKLCISHLENMLDANDARKVNLKGKKNLGTLVMKWDNGLQDAGVATNILDMLRPHETMNTLSITGYVGAEFPTWLGDPSFFNMVDLRIERCGKCMFLPAFGQLPFLKYLVIKGMDGVRSVGPEFYGEHCKQPFRSLVKLCFEDMHEWQDWSPCNKDFPCLHELSISMCPKLQGKLPQHLSSLEKLSIYKCEHLVVSIPSLPMLQELKIMRCKDLVDGFVKVKKLIIEYCQEVTSLSLSALEIKIESCESLVNIKLKSTLRTLTIMGCSALESLEFVMDEGGASSTSSLSMNEENLSSIGNNNASLLVHLKICDCPSLKCVSTIVELAAILDIRRCPNLTSLSLRDTLPTTLKFLRLMDCRSLKSIADKLPTTLKVLMLVECPKLESIADKLNKDALLEDLLIERCEKLRCLPRGTHELCHLKKIYIYRCNSLISLGDLVPTNLRSLKIRYCEKLEALPNNMHNLCHLKEIDIHRCNSLISLGDLLPTNLRRLVIEYCEKLEALPNNIHNLNFLQDLSIQDCPSSVSFPEEGFPTNLRKLWLRGSNLCKQIFELGLHRLTSLTYLWIAGGIMDSFPEEEDGKTMLMLPTSLTTLTIQNFPNLLFLSWKFFQNLSAIEKISIFGCFKLASLSEKCFPPSLRLLYISNCPVLKQNCDKDKGIMWSKIANIPSVIIDYVEQQHSSVAVEARFKTWRFTDHVEGQ